VIHLVKPDLKMAKDTLAVTHFYVDNDHKEVEWAIIYVKSNIEETVLEHEIGHALGFLHYNKINHLMNQKWAQGGWDTEGLSAPPR
jgi:peptide deformylase